MPTDATNVLKKTTRDVPDPQADGTRAAERAQYAASGPFMAGLALADIPKNLVPNNKTRSPRPI
jgi:hypothetical protein